jgi:PQQ-dependent catabolism-associated CXXCW motif protein
MAGRFIQITLTMVTALSGAIYPAQVFAQARPGVFADEDKDMKVPPTSELRTVGYHSPTPLRIPGGKVVTTGELKAMMEQNPRPYVIDVLGGGVHRTIAGAFWMLGAGAGDMNKDEEARFAKAIAAFAGGDKDRPMVFFCVDSECWLSYNAALRAIRLGYTNVMWYRGGIASWRVGENPMAQSDPFFW